MISICSINIIIALFPLPKTGISHTVNDNWSVTHSVCFVICERRNARSILEIIFSSADPVVRFYGFANFTFLVGQKGVNFFIAR